MAKSNSNKSNANNSRSNNQQRSNGNNKNQNKGFQQRGNNQQRNQQRSNGSNKPVKQDEVFPENLPDKPNNEQEYDNDNKGVLFQNNRKQKDEQPDLSGNITVNGVGYWLSAWSKVTEDGDKYLSLAANEKDNQDAKARGKLEMNTQKNGDNHPDMRGHLKINNETFELAGWFHNAKGENYVSIAISDGDYLYDESISGMMPWDF